ncbi:MAG: hypothetical protein JKX93_11085 [Rhizobiaceae bacterium]|nr:hypothetical protein [Rhizobiaceae bacterium]
MSNSIVKKIFKQIFKGQDNVSNMKPDAEFAGEMAEAAFEQFLEEGAANQSKQESNRATLSSVPSVNEQYSSKSDERSPVESSPVENSVEAYDAGRVKREIFIEGVKNDIVEFDKSLAQNELFVKQSREQLKRFKEFAHNSEIDLDIVYRLRNTNEALIEDVARYKKQNDILQTSLEMEKSKYVAAKNRYSEIRVALEKARENIVVQIERDTANRGEIAQHATAATQRETELSRLNRSLEKIEIEYETSREQYQRLSVEMESKLNSSMEHEKKLDETANELELEQLANEKLVGENKSVTLNLENLQNKNVELRSQLKDAEYEAEEVDKRVSERNRISDDELYSAQARVESLQSQLRVKSQISDGLQEQTKTALAEAEVSKEASRDLHSRLVEAMRQRDQDRDQVSNLNVEIDELNKRFESTLVKMEQSRRENMRLTKTLKLQKQAWGGTETISSHVFKEEAEQKIEQESAPIIPLGIKTH